MIVAEVRANTACRDDLAVKVVRIDGDDRLSSSGPLPGRS
jgi:hypothetical protein